MKYAHIDKDGKLLGWYDKEIHTSIPTPNIEVSEEQWQTAIDSGHNKVNQDGSTSYDEQPMATDEAIAYFKGYTNQYIQSRINKWNEDNKTTGIRFDDINSFPKYAVLPSDTRHDISVRFLTWNGAIWDEATAYMLSATTIPTEAEFKAMLDGVPF